MIRRCRLHPTVWLVLGALTVAGSHARADMEAIKGDWEAIRRVTGSLMQAYRDRLAADAKSGPARDFYLELDEAADRDAMHVVLRHRGGTWQAGQGWAPAWAQATMQEWRGFHHGNGAGCNWRPTQRFGMDLARLNADPDSLVGDVGVTMKLDQTRDELLPPGEPATWWDRFVATGYSQPRRQQFQLDAKILPGTYVLEMVLDGGVHWQGKKRKKAKPAEAVIKPILVRLQVPSSRFTEATASTPTWNGGFHEVDATGLKYDGKKFVGQLVVYIHGDGWVPRRGQMKPLKLVFDVKAWLEHGRVSGEFSATGDMGKYTGTIRGQGGQAVVGRYTAKGDLGPQTGSVRGYVITGRPDPAVWVDPPETPPAGGKDLMGYIAGTVDFDLHAIRALHLAIQHHPLPLMEALRQTDTASALLNPREPDLNLLAAYVKSARRAVQELSAKPAELPTPREETNAADTPGTGTVAMTIDAETDLPVLKDGPGWTHLPKWEYLGPFSQRLGVASNTAQVPEVIHVPGGKYVQAVDRFGANRADAQTHTWQAASASTDRVSPPWQKSSFYNRFRGEQWYARSVFLADDARKAWIAIEASEHTKLWVNGRLVWTGTEQFYRYRDLGRQFVEVELVKGGNEILVRGQRDRRPGWVRLSLSTRPVEIIENTLNAPDAPADNELFYPDAQPPLAWDVDAGTNVAWRNAELGGKTRPVVAGDRLLVTRGLHSLAAVEVASGKMLWHVDAESELAKDFRHRDKLRAARPASDGRTAWMLTGPGMLTAWNVADGKRRWAQPIHLAGGELHRAGSRLVVEGTPVDDWPTPKELATPEKDKRGKDKAPDLIGVAIVDPDNGKVLARFTWRGSFSDSGSQLLAVPGTGQAEPRWILHNSRGRLVDVAAAKDLGPARYETPGSPGDGSAAGGYGGGNGYDLTVSGGELYMTSQDHSLAVQFRQAGPDVAWQHEWESNYEHSGFGSFFAPSVTARGLLFTWAPILDRGPHCPDARMELHVQDAATGRPLSRVKPAMDQAVRHGVDPVVAGGYLFCFDSGGGSHGGHPTHAQVTIMTAEAEPITVAKNLLEMGLSSAPVFAGQRMFVRSGRSLMCIAVDGQEGKAHQARKLAEALLAEIGASPVIGEPRQIPPPPAPLPDRLLPVGKLQDDLATQYWLGAGPVSGDVELSGAEAASLAPRAGQTVAVDGKELTFKPVAREYAAPLPTAFAAQYSLQGTGENVPVFRTLVDPRAVAGETEGTGLLYTVLVNNRDRIVLPTLQADGVTQWLAGEQLRNDQPLHLVPGLYPLLVRVEPGYFHWEKPVIHPPINVAAALEAGAVQPVTGADAWKALGPLPADTAPLEPKTLKTIPEKVTIAGKDFPVYDAARQGKTLFLTALLEMTPGAKPNFAEAPKETPIGSPAQGYAFVQIEVPADGTLYVNSAADWFMRWYLDGKEVYSTMGSGNGAAPTDIRAQPFAVPVTKGKHVLAVEVKPGSKGWSLTCEMAFADKSAEAKLATFRVPSKVTVRPPDFRFAPAFKEIPHPPTRLARWRKSVRDRAEQLRAIVRDLPGTNQAQAARSMLQAAGVRE